MKQAACSRRNGARWRASSRQWRSPRRRCSRSARGSASAQAPKSPVTINVSRRRGRSRADAGRDRAYQQEAPELIAKINFTKAPAPELPGKLKAMQGAGRSDIELVLTGTDFLAAGIEQGLLDKILPDARGEVPEPDDELPAGGGEDAGARQGLRHRRGVHAGRSAARIQPRQGQAGADDAAGAARVVQGESEPARSMRARRIPVRAARSSWACPTSSATRTRRTRSTAGTRPGRT